MPTERITVSLPGEVRQAAVDVARAADMPLSAVVSAALTAWLRGRLVDAWLTEFQASHGPFDEAELEALAGEAGVPYLPAASRPSGA